MLVTLSACGGVGEYRPMGGSYASRGPGCDYRVIRNRIVESYEEIGVIHIEAFTVRQLPPNEERFRKVVGADVCRAGGHAVIPSVDLHGRWVQGTVIRFRPSECLRCREDGIYREAEAAGAEPGGEG